MTRSLEQKVSKKTRQQARALRRRQTSAENVLWRALRNRQLAGLKFRRQHPLGEYIVDFYCHDHRLVVEVDGDSHVYKKAYDLRRSRRLTKDGNRILRFTNHEITNQLNSVLEEIMNAYSKAN